MSSPKLPDDLRDRTILLETAKQDYFDGVGLKALAEKHQISIHTLREYIYKGVHGDRPWTEERKQWREAIKREAPELAKVNATRTLARLYENEELIHEILAEKARKGELSNRDLISYAKILESSLDSTYKKIVPQQTKPLINFMMNSKPELTEEQALQELIEIGLAKPKDE